MVRGKLTPNFLPCQHTTEHRHSPLNCCTCGEVCANVQRASLIHYHMHLDIFSSMKQNIIALLFQSFYRNLVFNTLESIHTSTNYYVLVIPGINSASV